MSNYELEQALACKQMEVEDLRKQLAEQAEAIDLQLHTNRRIAELEEKVAKWVEKAKNWTASPEAGKQLEGYRTMGAKCAELESERDQLRQQLTKAQAALALKDEALNAVLELTDESKGVAGWHLNGEVAAWESVLPELEPALAIKTDNTALREWGARLLEITAKRVRSGEWKPEV